MGLAAILGAATGGGPASMEFVAEWLKTNYIENDDEKWRRGEAAMRDAFYEGRGEAFIEKLIETAFQNIVTRELRKVLVQYAKWNNVIQRVVREKATVYSEPAQRHVANHDIDYQNFLELVMQDHAMRELDRKLALHEDAWIQYRVRITPRGPEPVLDVISPAKFWAIASPKDPTMLVGIILDQTPVAAKKLPTDPHYRVWTDDETFQLDEKCRIVSGSIDEWKLRRLPGVLATTRLPTTKGCLLAPCHNADVAAGHTAVWFENVLLLKESKSANKQAYLIGDISAATMGQAADTENEVLMPEGGSVQTVDRGLDLKQFRETSTQIVDDLGANHGLPPSVLHHRDASSGAEIYLRRIPLRELRLERLPFLRRVEREVVQLEADINALDPAGAEFRFDAEGWSMDFGELQQPLTESERDAVFEKRRELLLQDTIEEIMARNPDVKTPEDAMKILAMRVERETERVALMKDLMRMNGSVNSAPGENTPEQNGAQGAAAARNAKGGKPPPDDSGNDGAP